MFPVNKELALDGRNEELAGKFVPRKSASVGDNGLLFEKMVSTENQFSLVKIWYFLKN